jgi:hypothetical protein
MLADDALNISVMHRDYDMWIWTHMDEALKEYVSSGKVRGVIRIPSPPGLPHACSRLFPNICVECFKRWGYKVENELFNEEANFILSWGTSDYEKLTMAVPGLRVDGWRPVSENPSTEGLYLMRDTDGKWNTGEWVEGRWLTRYGFEPVQWAIPGELCRRVRQEESKKSMQPVPRKWWAVPVTMLCGAGAWELGRWIAGLVMGMIGG